MNLDTYLSHYKVFSILNDILAEIRFSPGIELVVPIVCWSLYTKLAFFFNKNISFYER